MFEEEDPAGGTPGTIDETIAETIEYPLADLYQGRAASAIGSCDGDHGSGPGPPVYAPDKRNKTRRVTELIRKPV